MYHDVVPAPQRSSSGFIGPGPDRYKVTPDVFAAHLHAIDAAGLRASLVTEPQGDPALHLTFDDGGASATEIGAVLAGRGVQGHFFVTTARLGAPGFMDTAALRELRAQGHLIGSHSHTHAALSRLRPPEIRSEWETSRRALEEALGEPVRAASVPGGFFSRRVADEAARTGYEHLFVSEPRLRSIARHGLRVHGRFAVLADTSAADIAALCGLSRRVIVREWVGWRLRSVARAALGPGYLELRRRLLARR